MSKTPDFLPKLRWQVTSGVAAMSMGIASITQFGYADPQWWSTPEVIGEGVPVELNVEANNFAAGNLGQVKNMVKHAAEHFAAQGIEVPQESLAMLNAWSVSDANNFAAVNVGQVKHASEPFWRKLIELGQAEESDIPWTADKSDDQNSGIANIGQIKNAFNFTGARLNNLDLDSDSDGIPDAWEIVHFGSIDNDPSGDYDNDSISNIQEFINGTDPTISSSDAIPEEELENYGLMNLDFTPDPLGEDAYNRAVQHVFPNTALLYYEDWIPHWRTSESGGTNTIKLSPGFSPPPNVVGRQVIQDYATINSISATDNGINVPAGRGLRQTFHMLPNTTYTYTLNVVSGLVGGASSHSFTLDIEGATVTIDGAVTNTITNSTPHLTPDKDYTVVVSTGQQGIQEYTLI